MSRYRLGDVELPVERGRTRQSEQMAWIEIPTARGAIGQDNGPGQREFELSGRWFKREGGIAQALVLDDLKENREPVVFQIDGTSWMVRFLDSENDLVTGEFTLSLREYEKPEQIVFEGRELENVGLSAEALALLRLKASAYWWRGIADRVFEWVTTAELQLASIREWLADGLDLATLPTSAVAQIRGAAGVVMGMMDSLIDATETLFDSSAEMYTEEEEVRKQALLLARQVRTRMALVAAACQAVPHREQTYIVQDGDTLPRIAARLNLSRGTEMDWVDVAIANAIEDPGALETGQVLTIPNS